MKRRAVWLASLALAACASVPPRPANYENPVLDRDFPDPAVLRDADDWFYAYATQSASGDRMLNIQVARSRDLVHWQHLGDALPAKPAWAEAKQRFWAPHVIRDAERNRYVMYYSAEPDTDRGTCLAVAIASTPAGPFADMGTPLICGAGIEHIDPMSFDDPRTGRRLLYWGSNPIRVRELKQDRLAFAQGSVEHELLAADSQRPYRNLIEGAWLIYRHGYYYLFFSGDRCCGSQAHYSLMVARAKDAIGPFETLETPILESSSAWRAPGHNSVATDDAGTDWILYHAMREGPQRLMLLDRLEWRDGWPRVSGGQPSASPQQAPALTQ